jgi:sirohydrochlorin ferrochelatase
MRAEVAFLAMARPLLEEKLADVAAADLQRVIVQPHLLFEGDLAESLRQHVARVARANPGKDWPVTPLLADALGEAGAGTELLVKAIRARCDESEADWLN